MNAAIAVGGEGPTAQMIYKANLSIRVKPFGGVKVQRNSRRRRKRGQRRSA